MSTFKNYLLADGKSTTSVQIIERSLYGFLNWCEDQRLEVEQVSYTDVLAYMKHMQEKQLSQRSIQMAVGHLKHFFNWQIKNEKRDNQPAEGIYVKGVQRTFLYSILPMKTLEAVYGTYEGNKAYLSGKYLPFEEQSHYTMKTRQIVFGLMIWQGLTLSDLKALKVADVKLREGVMDVPRSRRSNERTLKLQSIQIMDLMEYLMQVRPWYIRQSKKETDQLFLTPNGCNWGANFMYGLLTDAKSREPLIENPKQIRASVITHWLKNYNLREVQQMAGHRYISSTEGYRVNDLEDLKEDIGKYHPF